MKFNAETTATIIEDVRITMLNYYKICGNPNNDALKNMLLECVSGISSLEEKNSEVVASIDEIVNSTDSEKVNNAINEAVLEYLVRLGYEQLKPDLDKYNLRTQRALSEWKADRPVRASSEVGRTLVLDTETTGLDEMAEILQLSIIDADSEEVLWDKLYKPDVATSWEGAERVNGISPEMVKDAPSIFDDLAEIAKVLGSASKILAYNTAFDLPLLERYGFSFDDVEIDDAMCYGAVIYGELKYPYVSGEHDYSEPIGYKWQKLKNLAEWAGYDGDGWHNSTADCLATAYLYKRLREPEMVERYNTNKALHPEFLTDSRYELKL